MEQRHVLLFGLPRLFAQGVQDILEQQQDIVVLGPVAPGGDAAAIVHALAPDVVVVIGEGPVDPTFVAEITRLYPRLPVIHVDLVGPVVHLEKGEQVKASSSNLLAAIRGIRLAGIRPGTGG